MKKLIPQSIKNIYHLFQAIFANLWFGFPSRKLKIIGVTGTNGKTTTTHMIAKILEESGRKIAVASTINFKIGEYEWVNASKFTTLSSWALQKFLRQAVEAGCEYAVLEVSSHALDQNRLWRVNFSVAVLTNVTREHFDYHKTMEKYAKAKEKLFAMVSKKGKLGKEGKSVSIVNLAMEFADDFLKYEADEEYGYILETQNAKRKTQNDSAKLKIVIAEEIELGIDNSKFKISTQGEFASGGQNIRFFLNLPGDFNIENALAAVCVGVSQGIPLSKISTALSKIKGIPGRMEKIQNNRDFEIIVDYAVTPDSLEKLYQLIKKISSQPHPNPLLIKERERRIIAVFGACGERDQGKRPIMGEIVSKYADYCFVTNEDPYNENPVKIINEVFGGVVKEEITSSIPNFQANLNDQISNTKKEGLNAFRILDRGEAIKKALELAKPGDIVVVTGKGAEETMAVDGEMIPWNDPRFIREVLNKL